MVTNDALLAASHPEIIFDHMREGKKGNSGLGQPLRLWTAWQNGVATDQTGYRGLIVEQPYLKNAYGQVRASGADAAEEWQVRWLRYLLLGSATSRSKVDRGALPPWSEVSSTLGVTGLNFDVSLADFVLRGGVLRQVPTTP